MAAQKRHIAIDIGSSKTKIYIEKLGIVFNEATLVAVDNNNHKVVAVGDEAKKLIGKLATNVFIKYPMKNGIITDMVICRLFLMHVLNKYKNEIKGGIVTLACPVSVTKIEKEALVTAIKKLGVTFVDVQNDIKLAALGAGINVTTVSAQLCLDIGGGKTTAGIISYNETLTTNLSKIGGNTIDFEIIKLLRQKNQISIGEITAENIKNTIGALVKNKKPLTMTTYGYDLTTGMPSEISLSEDNISKIIISTFNNITVLVTSVLEESQNEIAVDIIRNGLVVTGGVANISGIKYFLETYFEIPVFIAKKCSTAVIDGAIAYKNKTFELAEKST